MAIKRTKKPKIFSAYRLSENAVSLVKNAAEATGKSEAEIVEECVVGQVETVVTAEMVRRKIAANPEAMAAVQNALKSVDRKKK